MSRKRTPAPAFASLGRVGAEHRQPLNIGGLRRTGDAEHLTAVMGLEVAPTPTAAPATTQSANPAHSPLPVATTAQGREPRQIATAQDLQTVVLGETILLSTQLIADYDANAREFYRASEVESTGESMAAHGQEVIANGWIGDGKVFLIDGGKRLRGARSKSITHIKVEIEAKPKSKLDAFLASRRRNVQRSAQTVYDDAYRFADLLKSGEVASQEALALALCEPGEPPKSQGWVSQIVSIAAIPRTVIVRLIEVDALCSKNAAYHIARLFQPAAQASLADPTDLDTSPEDQAAMRAGKIVESLITAASSTDDFPAVKVKELIDRALGVTKPQERARSHSEPAKVGSWDATLSAVPSKGIVRIEFSGLSEADTDKVRDHLRKLFSAKLG